MNTSESLVWTPQVAGNVLLCLFQNMSDLLARQQRAKYYQQFKDSRYTRLCKSDTNLDAEEGKQTERMQAISAIADRIVQDYPHVQPSLRKVALTYGSRILPNMWIHT